MARNDHKTKEGDVLIISWNVEAGCRPGFMECIQVLANIPNVSVLCFQEVHYAFDDTVSTQIFPKDPGNRGENAIRTRLYQEIVEALGPVWTGCFAPQLIGYLHDTEPCDHPIAYGQATFVRQSAEVQIVGQTFGPIYRHIGEHNTEMTGGDPSCKSGIATTLRVPDGGLITVGNVHGLWSMYGKCDIPERTKQNSGISSLLAREAVNHGPLDQARILLVGDLNCHTGMQSLEQLRGQLVFGLKGGGVNLNHRFEIRSTRTEYYPADKPYREADFAIASRTLASLVHDFTVDFDVPSDHAMLLLELDMPT